MLAATATYDTEHQFNVLCARAEACCMSCPLLVLSNEDLGLPKASERLEGYVKP